jgi:CBS domain-containing protein
MLELEKTSLEKPITELMTKSIVTAKDGETIKELVEKILTTGHRRIPITSSHGLFKKRKLVGIITAMDILDVWLRGVDFKEKIKDIMVREVVFCYDDERLRDVIKKFQFSRRGGLPVVNRRKEVVGIITEKDVTALFLNKKIDLPVTQFMTRKPFVIKKQGFLTSLKILVNTKYRKLPIIDEGKFAGLFTDRLCLKAIYENEDVSSLNNTDYCVKNVMKLKEDDCIDKAIKIMIENNVGGIPVLEEERIIGIITERDIVDKIKLHGS